MRVKKQVLKKRADGRYACKLNGVWFYGKSSDEALEKRNEYKRKLVAGERILKHCTVSAYAAKWLPIAKAGIRNATYNQYAHYLNVLCQDFGDKLLQKVTPSDIKSTFTKHYIKKSNSCLQKAYQIYAGMFQAAIQDGCCTKNPCRSKTAKPHKGTTGSHRQITEEQRRLIHSVHHPMQDAAMIMLYSGLRIGQVIPLNYNQDIINGQIRVTKAAHYQISKTVVQNVGKTKAAIRNVPVFPPLDKFIEGKTGLVIQPQKQKGYISKSSMERTWSDYNSALSKAAGRNIKIRCHDLRHSFCCWCCKNGINIKTLMYWMGHADQSMILRVYDHLSDSRIQAEKQKLIRLSGQEGSHVE